MRQEQRRQATREAIVRAAEKLFKQHGVEGTKIDDIAVAANVARGSVYNAFATKEEIVLAIGRRDFRKVAEGIRARLGSASAKDLLSELFLASCRWHSKNRHLSETMLAAPFRLSAKAALIPPDPSVSFRRLAEEVLRSGQEQGAFRRDIDAAALSEVLAGIFVQAVAYWLRLPKSASLEHWTQQLLLVFWEGAQTRGGES